MADGQIQFGAGTPLDRWRLTRQSPAALRRTDRLDEVPALVSWAEREALQGHHVALVLAYEAAPAFDAALRVRNDEARSLPLAWAASYVAAEPARAFDVAAGRPAPASDRAPLPLLEWVPTIEEAHFGQQIARILSAITAGDTYQVNYTFPLTAAFDAEPWAWFRACAHDARVPFAACIDLGDQVVMSLSPELFLERRSGTLTTRPMKGTTRRGRWLEEDEQLAAALATSDKARAENVMIVDLLRNDLGRIAQTGSVQVRDLCRLERYPTVWQLTSTVDATLRDGTTLLDILRATFPCGSITGAPKVRTMQLIAELEAAPRGLYTGAICLLQPGGDFVASVPIRTVVLDRRTGVATFSVGAGITADSRPAEEWAECLAKARVVRPPAVPADARLFETMRLECGQLQRRPAHVARLCGSATLFGWDVSRSDLDAVLDRLEAAHPAGVWRARVFLSRTGHLHGEAIPFEADTRPWRVAFATRPVDTRSPLLFNKTTRRESYDSARATVPGVDDVLLWNSRRELTEGTLGNLVVQLDGRRVTPPIACGLLPGVFRQELLTRGEIDEQVVRLDDIARASRLWLVNSLREWIDVSLVTGR